MRSGSSLGERSNYTSGTPKITSIHERDSKPPSAEPGGLRFFFHKFPAWAASRAETKKGLNMSFLTPLSVGSNASLRSRTCHKHPGPITAQLTGSHRCECVLYGLSASGHAPTLVLCRELLNAGANPDSSLVVYREGVLALRIRSIREGAKLTVEDAESGTPRFRLARPPRRGAASPMRKNGGGGA